MITGLEQQLGPLDQLLSFVEDGAVGVSFDGQRALGRHRRDAQR